MRKEKLFMQDEFNEEDLKDTNGIHKYYHLPQDVTTIKYYFQKSYLPFFPGLR